MLLGPTTFYLKNYAKKLKSKGAVCFFCEFF